MVSIKGFGWRIGNQMFQLAAAIALADKNDDTVAFPEWEYAKYFAGNFTPSTSKIDSVYSSAFNYEPIPYSQNMAIDGYFQSEKFFENCTKKIKRIFDIKMSEDLCEIKGFDEGKKQIGIHIRRGDYLKYPDHHPTQDLSYYHKGIQYIREKTKEDFQIVVFSDDLDWCKENFSKDYLYPNADEVETLFLMTRCHHYVICNSSFSWWGAYLSKNKDAIVVAPKLWFGPAYAHFNTKDIYCKDWIKI